MPKPEPTSADIARGYGIDLNAPSGQESGITRMQREAVARSHAEKTAREAAGLGFWRLVWIVALGILLAQAIAGIALWVIRTVSAP